MRLSNRNKAGMYSFMNTVLLMIFLGGILLFILEKYKFNYFGKEEYLILLVPVLVTLVFYLRGRQIFEYDSDGEALNFKNRHIIPFIDKPSSDEFPKYKLVKFDILNARLFKRLYVTISSKKNHSVILKYDISYLTTKEQRDLKISLNKVLKANREKQSQTSE